MKIEYGPPGAIGVKHIQYLSADEPDYKPGLSRLARPVAALAAGTWAFALATDKKKLRQTALGVAAGAFLVALVAR